LFVRPANSLRPRWRPSRGAVPVFLVATHAWHEALALVKPHLHADLAVGRIGFCEAVVDIRSQRLQGQLPVLAPASLVSVDGPLLPSGVDAVLVSAPTPELLAAEAAEVRANLAAVGGGLAGGPVEGGPAVIAELDVVLDSRGQSAAARLAELDAFTAWESPRARFVGTAAGLAEFLAELLASADGVRIHPAVLDVELEELAQLVLPELRRRGVLRPALSGGTFRELLGLERPENRYNTKTEEIA